jgi:NADPH:quinone reductase-like Zn-dependent oxidoreductase
MVARVLRAELFVFSPTFVLSGIHHWCRFASHNYGEPMNKAITPHGQFESTLSGQTIVVIGGSAGIGLASARRAHAEGAKVILTARNPEPLERAAREIDALSIAAFDATDFKLLAKFFDDLPFPVDHVLVTGPGPYYAALADFDLESARET